MKNVKAKCRFSTTHSATSFPLGFFAVIACVFCPCNIQADEPTIETIDSGQRISESASAVSTLPGPFENQAARHDGDGVTIPAPAISDGVIRVKVQGSYEISMGGIGVARGEGTTTLELDGLRLERLFHEFEDWVRGSRLFRRDDIDSIISLPSTIRSTNETLKMLSDPETQEALRQVESLLRLLPKTPVHSKRQNDADSEEE